MSVNISAKNYLDENKRVELSKQIDNKKLIMNISILSDNLIEYQKNLFMEFFSSITEWIEKLESFKEYKSFFEATLEDFNTKLRVFQEKSAKTSDKYEIRGSIHLVWDDQYISSLIWTSSIIIFRDTKLLSVIANEVYDDDKIDIFSEMVEWEVENQDKILAVACNVYDYLWDEEIEEVISAEDVIQKMEEILTVKIDSTEIVSISLLEVHFKTIKINRKINKNKLEDTINSIKKVAKKNRLALSLVIWVMLIGIIVIGIFKSLSKTDKPTQVVTDTNGEEIVIDMDDIKRDIDAFEKISADSPTKKEKYQEIMKKLEALKNNNIQSLDVSTLENKMEASFYEGFNVKFVSKKDGLLEDLYDFNDSQLSTLWNIKGFGRTNKIHVYWEKGTLLYIINKKQKPILQELKVWGTITTCNTDLYNDGLYCASSNGDLYRFYKEGMKQLTNASGKWPNNIISIGKYKDRNIYTYTKDSALEWEQAYITKYVNTSKGIRFSSPTYYTFDKTTTEDMKTAVKNGTNMVVDGTFLIWSPTKWLLQWFRPNLNKNALKVREIKWWRQAIIQEGDLSGDVKVITSDNTKYIYLYDKKTQSVIAYITSPYKDNTKYQYSYSVKYKFKIKLKLEWEEVKDIDVKFGTNHTLYILTDKWVYKMSMKEFMSE